MYNEERDLILTVPTSHSVFIKYRLEAEHLASLLINGLKIKVWVDSDIPFTVSKAAQVRAQPARWTTKIMYLNWSKRRIYLAKLSPSENKMAVDIQNLKGFQIDDMVEVRRGRLLPSWDRRFNFEIPSQDDVNQTKVIYTFTCP